MATTTQSNALQQLIDLIERDGSYVPQEAPSPAYPDLVASQRAAVEMERQTFALQVYCLIVEKGAELARLIKADNGGAHRLFIRVDSSGFHSCECTPWPREVEGELHIALPEFVRRVLFGSA